MVLRDKKGRALLLMVIEGKVTDTAVQELLKAGKISELEELLQNE